MLRFCIQALLVGVVFVAAWRSGGKPERYVATIYFTMFVTASAHGLWELQAGQARIESIYQFRCLLDVGAFAAVVFLALKYDRWWTLWVGSVQLLAVMAHVLRAIELPMPLLVYTIMERWPVWMAVLLTGLGTVLHHRRSQAVAIDT